MFEDTLQNRVLKNSLRDINSHMAFLREESLNSYIMVLIPCSHKSYNMLGIFGEIKNENAQLFLIYITFP